MIEPEVPASTAASVATESELAAGSVPMLEEKVATSPAAPTPAAAAPARRRVDAAQPKPEAVIPLVHAPDDPGPEADVVEDVEPQRDPQSSGWRKMFERKMFE